MILLGGPGTSLAVAKAEVTHYFYRVPASYAVWHYCYGELVHWNGFIQWESQVAIDSQGGSHAEIHGLSKLVGTGQESGLKYEMIWNDKSSQQLKGPGPWEFSDTYNSRIVRQGEGPVLMFSETWVTTISTTGEWSSYRADTKWYCEAEASLNP
jgi:hypothetical protein